MKLNIKHLSGKHFEIEADPSETVLALKQKIEQKEGVSSAAVANQKLIYSGKILQDASVLSESNMKESDFIVLMLTKPKTAKPEAAASNVPQKIQAGHAEAGAPSAAAIVGAVPAGGDSAPTPDSALPSSSAPADSTSGPQSGILIGAPLQAAIQNLVDMGFQRDEVVKAMKASFNNPERAVQYLTEGNIPSSEPTPVVGNATSSAAAATDSAPQQAGADLQSNPQLSQLLQMMQQDPASMAGLIQQLQQSNPQLLELINQNPAALLSMLGGADALGGMDGGDEDEAGTVTLTEDELAAVQRLEALGFDRQSAVTAFIICDKNEELAANYLFDQTGM